MRDRCQEAQSLFTVLKDRQDDDFNKLRREIRQLNDALVQLEVRLGPAPYSADKRADALAQDIARDFSLMNGTPARDALRAPGQSAYEWYVRWFRKAVDKGVELGRKEAQR